MRHLLTRQTLALAAIALPAAFAALPAAHAAGKVEVTYIEPENFRDIGFSNVERERSLRYMQQILEGLGAKLPDGQVLKLQVTDIKLAGVLRSMATGERRVLRGGADWPEVKLQYTLQGGDKLTIKSGEAKIYDLTYLYGSTMLDTVGTALPYERRMMRRWFADTIASSAVPQ